MFSRKNSRTNTTQKKHTGPYVSLYHVTREQSTLVAPRLWAEEGVGRAKFNNDEKATVLRLRQWRFTRSLADTKQGGRQDEIKNGKNRPKTRPRLSKHHE